MQTETMKLSIDTGSVLVEIDDKGEIIGKFRFNPNDLDIIKRYEKVVDALNNIDVPEDVKTDEIFKITDELKLQVDYLLNYKASEELFSMCNPLTLTANGDFYIENVLDGIGGLIEKTTDTRLKKKKAKIQKATAKYHR